MTGAWGRLRDSAAWLVTEACAVVVRWSGLPWLVRNTYSRRRVGILLYHDPAPEVFERHLRYLARRYVFIPLETLVTALHSRAWSTIPANALVLTFDDGYSGNAALIQLFAAFGVVPTIYVCSQVVGTNRHFWWTRAGRDADALKRLEDGERKRVLRERYGFDALHEYPVPEALTATDIDLLRRSVDFQSHSRFHPILTQLPEPDCRAEVEGSRREVEELARRPCTHFAYPNGDYGVREIRVLRELGFRSARTIDAGWNNRRTDPYRLKILGVSDDASVSRLAANLAGFSFVKRFLMGSFDGRCPPTRSARRRSLGAPEGEAALSQLQA